MTQDLAVDADQTACTAPGYAYPAQADFGGWTGSTPQNGWTVTAENGSTHTWEFDDPGFLPNETGGTGNFASADSWDNGGASIDTDLVSPVIDLTGQPSANLQLDSAFMTDLSGAPTSAEIDLSTDGGTTWSPVWNGVGWSFGPVTVPLTQADGKPDVQLRFHYDGSGDSAWQLERRQRRNLRAWSAAA